MKMYEIIWDNESYKIVSARCPKEAVRKAFPDSDIVNRVRNGDVWEYIVNFPNHSKETQKPRKKF
jgi:hypothetical protein